MEVMTFNVDKDRRNLTDDTQNFDIDFSDSKYSWLAARQYENQMRQVQLNLQHGDGAPLDLTGANVVFEGLLPDGEHRVIDAKHSVILDAVNGQARFDFPAQAFTIAGSYKQAFFRVYRNGLNVASLEFSLEVYADKVISGLIPADYITPFLDQYGKLQDIIDNASGDLKIALQKWIDKFQDAFNGWSGDYTEVQATVTSVTASLGTLETQIKSDGLFTQADFENIQSKIDTQIEQLSPTTAAVTNAGDVDISVDGGVQEPFTTALSSFSSRINADSSVLKIGLLQDIHYQRSVYTAGYGEATSRGLLHIQHMGALKDKLNLVVYNGDTVHGREVKANTIKRISQLTAAHKLVFGDLPTIWTIGNHDDNNVYFDGQAKIDNTLSLGEVKTAFGIDQTYGYQDFQDQKVRVIVMDAFENPEIYDENGASKYPRSYNSVFAQTQLSWIAEALTTTPAGYSVIGFMHCPPVGFDGNLPYSSYQNINHDLLLGIYKAFIAGTNYIGTGTNSDYPATVNVDFTTRGAGVLVGIVCGHEHHDLAPQTIDGVRVIERTCNLSNGDGRVLGNLSEDAFDVIEVDAKSRHCKLNRFGLGDSVEFDY